jgi:hypothetical protein
MFSGGVRRGYCFLNPPAIFSNGVIMRPTVDADGNQSGCGQHKQGAPIEVTKVQPETVGAAAKQARQEKNGVRR